MHPASVGPQDPPCSVCSSCMASSCGAPTSVSTNEPWAPATHSSQQYPEASCGNLKWFPKEVPLAGYHPRIASPSTLKGRFSAGSTTLPPEQCLCCSGSRTEQNALLFALVFQCVLYVSPRGSDCSLYLVFLCVFRILFIFYLIILCHSNLLLY